MHRGKRPFSGRFSVTREARHQQVAFVAAVLSLAVLVGTVLLTRGGGGMPSLNMAIAPQPTVADPGPQVLLGAPADPKGTNYLSANYYLDGAGDVRIYFDRVDNLSYHFADRRGNTVQIGLSEAGVEQVLARGAITNTAPLRIARNGPNIAVFEGSLLAACAFDDRLIGGSAGLRALGDAGAAPPVLRAEPRDEIHFADDFMLTESRGAQWRTVSAPGGGEFAVKSLRNPLLSTNAFSFMGAGKNVLSVTGEPWWDNYVYNASLRGPVGAAVGLVFACYDDHNYGLFRWTARKYDENGQMTDPGRRQIVRVHDGEETVLADVEGGYRPDQWYAAEVRMTYSRVRISIDGQLLMETSDPHLASGAAGVWCDVARPAAPAIEPRAQSFQNNYLSELMKQHAVIDDVRVATVDGFEDDFRVPGPLSRGWLVGPGDWGVRTTQSGAGCGELTVKPLRGSTKALIGDRNWAQYELSADVRSGGGPAGVLFLHRDESNFYSALLDDGALKLVRVTDGHEQIVDSVALPPSEDPVVLRVSIRHGHVRVTANGIYAVETFDGDSNLRGRTGFVASAARMGSAAATGFSNFRLSFLPEPEPLVTTNAVFEEEMTMNDWTSPSSEWFPPRDQLLVDGRPVNLLWHRSQFPGDVELRIEPREFPEQKYDVALSVAKDGQGRNNGYVFRYKVGDVLEGGGRGVLMQIYRQGIPVAEKAVPEEPSSALAQGDDAAAPRQLASLAVRRCGKYIVGLVNGKPSIQFRDEEPLSGSKVAYYTQGVILRSEATRITSNSFRNDLFSAAPTGWRTAGSAIAEVINRWQCDPRWSFFSLRNDRTKGKPAVLWSKYLYPGDVTIEFFVGNRMEGERGQPYTYARDINVSICSDGQDLTKGYTFMWGGFGNTASVILRDGVEVKRIGKTIPTDMNWHRHWFNYKVEKQGNRLTFKVDRIFMDSRGEKGSELVFEDSQPISGDRVAIWTYDHTIMISRVRISGEGGQATEAVDWQPAPLRTPYDNR
jgi:hypothetical protein